MKKFIFLMMFIVIIFVISVVLFNSLDDHKVYESGSKDTVIESSSTLSIMLEDGYESGMYEVTSNSAWPSSGYTFNEKLSSCVNGGTLRWDSDTNIVYFSGTSKDYCYIYFDVSTVEFDYIGDEQTYTVAVSGTYKLEVWGAQGGSYSEEYHGGYGGYSVGEIYLDAGTVIYINVGGQGSKENGIRGGSGGYNGGGDGGNGVTYNDKDYPGGSGGGGATHIALVSGVLNSLESYIGNYDDSAGVYSGREILIVAGGGGGCIYFDLSVGHAGGYQGVSTTIYSGDTTCSAGTQSTGYAFGQGGAGRDSLTYYRSGAEGNSGSGGGFFCGYSCTITGEYTVAQGSGGSGYIGNSSLTNKSMYCYDCTESTDVDTYTVSTTNVSNYAISYYAKLGNGYAKITYLGK